MSVMTGILLYVCIWFVVIFTVLPWGVQRAENPEAGHEIGAPERPRLWLKALVTTGIAAVIWGIAFYLITSGIISLRPE